MSGSIYSVSQVNSYIHDMFAQDYLLNRIRVRGEISNCKYHTSGHIYFTLKDEKAAVSCVMFAGFRSGLRFRLENGLRVIAAGNIGVYERGGTYQLYAKEITADGTGALYERFEALKQQLSDMGMFDESYKKPIPKFIRTLGVVTAPTGAAVRDIIQIARRRNPGIQIILYPAKVQGEDAAQSVAEGIEVLDRYGVDVIIAGRGGGSLEDLWAFNEEITARAVFACNTPVISAVGHETDVVITDFVADLRAPTPSAAAELAVADMRAVCSMLEDQRHRLYSLMMEQVRSARNGLESRERMLSLASPGHRIQELRLHLEDRSQRLQSLMSRKLLQQRQRLELAAQRLESLSPSHRLSQGMAVITAEDGRMIRRAGQIRAGDNVRIIMQDGRADAVIRDVQEDSQNTRRLG